MFFKDAYFSTNLDILAHLVDYDLYSTKEIHILTDDKINLLSWFHLADNKLPLLIYFHGNSFSIGDRAFRIKKIY